MQTIGFIGVGKIGLPICENLIKSGYRVLGYRRSSLADFEKLGGVPAKSPAEIGAQCDIVFSCVPTVEAMNEVVNGPNGLMHSARPGQIIVELGSHPVPDKQKHVATLAEKGAAYIDGEVSGTPGMAAARKAVIYLAGDAEACKKIEPVVKGFADLCLYLGPFGCGDQRQAHQQHAGRDQHRGRRRGGGARAEGRRRHRPDDQGDRQRQRRLDPVRHPRALDGGAPVQAGAGLAGAARALFREDRGLADTTGAATPLFDRAVELYQTLRRRCGRRRRQRRRRHGRRARVACRAEKH